MYDFMLKFLENKRFNIWSDERGNALIEYLLVLPLFLLLFIPLINFFHYIQVNQKMEKVAYTVGDIIASSKPATGGGVGKNAAQCAAINADKKVLTFARLQTMIAGNADGTPLRALMSPISFVDGNGVLTVSLVYMPLISNGGGNMVKAAPVYLWQIVSNSVSVRVTQDIPTPVAAPEAIIANMRGDEVLLKVDFAYDLSPLALNGNANAKDWWLGPIFPSGRITTTKYYPIRDRMLNNLPGVRNLDPFWPTC